MLTGEISGYMNQNITHNHITWLLICHFHSLSLWAASWTIMHFSLA